MTSPSLVPTTGLRPGMRVVLRSTATRSLPGGTLAGIVQSVLIRHDLAVVCVDTRTRVVKIRCRADEQWRVIEAATLR